jgi:hypothetical protein
MQSFFNPYENLTGGIWQKSNFHGHTEQEINFETLEIKDKGYDNLAHQYKNAGYTVIANADKAKYVTYESLSKELGISIFPAEEDCTDYDGIVLVGIKKFYDCPPQEAIDGCLADGGFCFIAHPNQNPGLKFDITPPIPSVYPYEVIDSLERLTGMEIYNGCLPHHPDYKGMSFGDGLATGVWDRQLSKGKKLWGFASDDAHEAYEINTGWTEIYAPSNRWPDILEAVKQGKLCACRAMRLYSFSLSEDGLLSVEADYTYYRRYTTEYRFIGKDGVILATGYGKTATYHLSGDEKYVRVEARAPDGSMLWTQPVLNKACFDI